MYCYLIQFSFLFSVGSRNVESDANERGRRRGLTHVLFVSIDPSSPRALRDEERRNSWWWGGEKKRWRGFCREPLSRHLFKAEESSSVLVIGSSTGRQCRRCALYSCLCYRFCERSKQFVIFSKQKQHNTSKRQFQSENEIRLPSGDCGHLSSSSQCYLDWPFGPFDTKVMNLKFSYFSKSSCYLIISLLVLSHFTHSCVNCRFRFDRVGSCSSRLSTFSRWRTKKKAKSLLNHRWGANRMCRYAPQIESLVDF